MVGCLRRTAGTSQVFPQAAVRRASLVRARLVTVFAAGAIAITAPAHARHCWVPCSERSGIRMAAPLSPRVGFTAMIGGPQQQTTDEEGRLQFPALHPGVYVLDIHDAAGFRSVREEGVAISAGGAIDRAIVLTLSAVRNRLSCHPRARTATHGILDSLHGSAAMISAPSQADDRACSTRSGAHRASRRRHHQAASPPSDLVGLERRTRTLFKSTARTLHLPQNGAAGAEPGIDFVQKVRVQSVGASAEFGNAPGAVVNIVTRGRRSPATRRVVLDNLPT